MSPESRDGAGVAQQVWAAVAGVTDPEIGLPLGELGMLRGLEMRGATATLRVALTVPGCPMKDRIARDIAAAAGSVAGIEAVEVEFEAMADAERGAIADRLRDGSAGERFFDDGRTIVIAVASGKGGVGKSTVTANLACAFAAAGRRVGVVDADVWGFSIPRMFGVTEPPVGFDGMLFPAQAHGVKLVSVGLFAGDDTPVIWRGPMLHTAVRQFLGDVHWGELDVLLCDLPPGTGDVPISLLSMLPTASMLVVTTPQDAARAVAARAGRMAERAGLRVSGVIENMSAFVCPCCGERTEIFGDGGGAALAEALGAPLLARVPVTPELRQAGDAGLPIMVGDPGSAAALEFSNAARRLSVRGRPRRRSPAGGGVRPAPPAGAMSGQRRSRA